jgi:hypothetical protein
MKPMAFILIAAGIGLVVWQSGMFSGIIPKSQAAIQEEKDQSFYELLRGRCEHTYPGGVGACQRQAYERAFGRPYEG